MSGGSVFGMTSDFNFEQSPYNEAALNCADNRQNANNQKSVEPVRYRNTVLGLILAENGYFINMAVFA